VTGYNDKIGLLVLRFIQELKNLKIDPDRFKILHDKVKRDTTNFFVKQPYYQIAYFVDLCLTVHQWSYDQREKFLEGKKPQQKRYSPFFFRSNSREHKNVFG